MQGYDPMTIQVKCFAARRNSENIRKRDYKRTREWNFTEQQVGNSIYFEHILFVLLELQHYGST
jgi:hypothetical protein